ncbi:flagellar biosynthesis protein FliQ [Treponema sp.]|uniref:flagellar biosynthesis protein FliQ n=1 Tax=Treponema sp. TaxID=166 RepID=UPI00298E48D6|nr:flagellar biosynthesis protein FliQ [Treponema sp.]MCR5613423.1 flagellar biosynthesis protein FliQ [Treponema sp.]
MQIGEIINLMRDGIMQVLILTAPVLGSALIIGLVVAIFQATTSIQEQTLTFLPKLLVILFVLALIGGWMFSTVADYTRMLFSQIANIT